MSGVAALRAWAGRSRAAACIGAGVGVAESDRVRGGRGHSFRRRFSALRRGFQRLSRAAHRQVAPAHHAAGRWRLFSLRSLLGVVIGAARQRGGDSAGGGPQHQTRKRPRRIAPFCARARAGLGDECVRLRFRDATRVREVIILPRRIEISDQGRGQKLRLRGLSIPNPRSNRSLRRNRLAIRQVPCLAHRRLFARQGGAPTPFCKGSGLSCRAPVDQKRSSSSSADGSPLISANGSSARRVERGVVAIARKIQRIGVFAAKPRLDILDKNRVGRDPPPRRLPILPPDARPLRAALHDDARSPPRRPKPGAGGGDVRSSEAIGLATIGSTRLGGAIGSGAAIGAGAAMRASIACKRSANDDIAS